MSRPRIEPFDATVAPEADLRALYRLEQELHEELWSAEPLSPFHVWAANLRAPMSWRVPKLWVVRDGSGSEVDGVSTYVVTDVETNRHLAEADVSVRAAARGRGLGRALLAPVVEQAERDGRTLLTGGAVSGGPGIGFAERLGATAKSTERMSRLELAGVDRPLLESWVVQAKERAEGYSLLAWDGPVPDEHLEAFVQLRMVMNTAPRDELDMEDWLVTPERHREAEQKAIERGSSWWTLVARHDDTGELAGFTEFAFPPHDDTTVFQEATAVDPVHRDRGLGRWLKAANCLRLLDERPSAERVITWNAFSNGPMLGINVAMGFELAMAYTAYQVPTADLAATVAAKG